MNISFTLNQNINRNYQSLASGKQINVAADNAAGLTIANKLKEQSNGYDVGKRNVSTSQDMINIADGALSSITDNLQRIRELSIQAASDVYTDSDKKTLQAEIDHLKQAISDTASQTQFNTMNLLDGTLTKSNVAAGPDGKGIALEMPNATLGALGIADYDVTGDFDLTKIDKALEKVSSARSDLGASSNRLDHMVAYNSLASYNLTSSRSRLEDLDMAKGITDLKKNQLLQTVSFMMMKKKEDQEGNKVIQMFQPREPKVATE